MEIINSRLLTLERAFIIDFGLDKKIRRANFRHVIFSPLENEHQFPTSHFTSATIALILDPAIKWASSKAELKNECLESIRLAFEALHYAIESATLILKLEENL